MKVGDYVRIVRSNITYIRKIKSIYLKRMGGKKTSEIIVDKPFDYRYTINDDKILKSSSNIIDLIEVGDYINGCLIVEITQDPFIKGQINLWTNMIISEGEPFPNEYYKMKILEEDIKSIVTKEQFESMKYEVGE